MRCRRHTRRKCASLDTTSRMADQIMCKPHKSSRNVSRLLSSAFSRGKEEMPPNQSRKGRRECSNRPSTCTIKMRARICQNDFQDEGLSAALSIERAHVEALSSKQSGANPPMLEKLPDEMMPLPALKRGRLAGARYFKVAVASQRQLLWFPGFFFARIPWLFWTCSTRSRLVLTFDGPSVARHRQKNKNRHGTTCAHF